MQYGFDDGQYSDLWRVVPGFPAVPLSFYAACPRSGPGSVIFCYISGLEFLILVGVSSVPTGLDFPRDS